MSLLRAPRYAARPHRLQRRVGRHRDRRRDPDRAALRLERLADPARERPRRRSRRAALFLGGVRLQGLGLAAALPPRPAPGHARARRRRRRCDRDRARAAGPRRRGRADLGRAEVPGHAASVSARSASRSFLLGLIDNAAMTPIAAVSAGHRRSERLGAGRADRRRRRGRARRRVRRLPAEARAAPPRRALQVRLLGRRAHGDADGGRARLGARRRSRGCCASLAVFVLLDALSVRTSMPLALGFLCASASAAALPIAPAGGVAQAGAGAALLVSSGIHASEAAAFAVAAQGMIVLAGAGVLVLTTMLHLRAIAPGASLQRGLMRLGNGEVGDSPARAGGPARLAGRSPPCRSCPCRTSSRSCRRRC